MLTQSLQWRLWLFQLSIWLLLLPAYNQWTLPVFALLLLAKLWQLYRDAAPWSLGRSNLLAALLLLGLVLSARSLGVIHLMFHFLLLAAILRLLGLTEQRRQDAVQLLWVHYFLLACAFILHQDLWLAMLVFAAFILNLHCQYLLFSDEQATSQRPNRLRQFKRSLFALSALLLLFVLFPRLPPLWQLPGAKLAQTGLTDRLSPGQVSELLDSDALAFRVRFHGDPPQNDQLYFRAKIYQLFDGQNWLAERQSVPVSPQPATSRVLEYTVIAEPHQQFSLFALGQPHQLSQNLRLNRSQLIYSEQRVSQRISYQLQSSLQNVAASGALQPYLQLPNGNLQSRQLAAQLRQGHADTKSLIAAISQYFSGQGFRYSLSPGQIIGEQIDGFLFERKTGFCSHYAGAAVFLLRAAGVPARLVGGYLGGSWQDNGSYLQVQQRQAHAWVEYYLNGSWVLYDPTALIEPDLLQSFSANAELAAIGDFNSAWLTRYVDQWLLQPLRDLDYYWSAWVLSFDATEQRSLLGRLQQINWQLQPRDSWWLLLSAVFALWWWWRRPPADPTRRLFQHLLALQPKEKGQSYQQYLQQWRCRKPELSDDFALLLNAYLGWQFAGRQQDYATALLLSRKIKRALK